MKILITFLVLLISNVVYAESWQAKSFKVSFEYDAKEWKLLPPKDTANDLLVGLRSKKGASIVIRVQKDTPKEKLTNEQYADYLKQLMVDFNKSSKFVDQDAKTYSGLRFTQLKFFQNDAKWGPILNTYNFYRDGKHLVNLTLSNPRVGESQKLPKYLTQQVSKIKLNF